MFGQLSVEVLVRVYKLDRVRRRHESVFNRCRRRWRWCSTELLGVGVLITGWLGFRSAAISSNFGLTTKKNRAAKAPPLNNRKTRTPADD